MGKLHTNMYDGNNGILKSRTSTNKVGLCIVID